jgi:hypothetical protein
VKIASWACLNINDVASNVNTNSCYYATYGNPSTALANSNPNTDISSISDFYMIYWGSCPYYDKTSLICLIIFCFLPGSFFTFQAFLVYAANRCEDSVRNFFTREKQ